jgi:hypothetical protein
MNRNEYFVQLPPFGSAAFLLLLIHFVVVLFLASLAQEAGQHALGGFQLVELVAQLCPFGIEPPEALGNPAASPV